MEELISRKRLSELIPMSRAALDNLVAGRMKGMSPLPRVKIGQRVFFRPETVRAWLAQNEKTLEASNG